MLIGRVHEQGAVQNSDQLLHPLFAFCSDYADDNGRFLDNGDGQITFLDSLMVQGRTHCVRLLLSVSFANSGTKKNAHMHIICIYIYIYTHIKHWTNRAQVNRVH